MSKQLGVTFRNEYSVIQNYMPSFPSPSKNAVVKQSNDALPECEKAPDSPVTNPLNPPAGYNNNSVIAELEKRRAEFIALACAAEARAQEAEEKCVQAENRLGQETNQRLVAEQRLRALEDRLRQQQAVEIERMQTLEEAPAEGEAEARLKKAESRIKEAENNASSLALALAKAYQQKAEAEAAARAAEEKASIAEALFLKSEGGANVAVEGNLLFGLLIFADKSKMRAIAKAIRNVEARHRPQEDYLENLLQKQPSELWSIPETAPLAEGAFTSLNLSKSVDHDHACCETEQKGLGIKLRFLTYGIVITLLIGAGWYLIKALLQS